MVSEKVTILNETGLHARPAAVFVSTAAKFKSELALRMGEKQANAKSILSVLALGAAKGSEIEITAQGPDEKEALDKLIELIRSGFDK